MLLRFQVISSGWREYEEVLEETSLRFIVIDIGTRVEEKKEKGVFDQNRSGQLKCEDIQTATDYTTHTQSTIQSNRDSGCTLWIGFNDGGIQEWISGSGVMSRWDRSDDWLGNRQSERQNLRLCLFHLWPTWYVTIVELDWINSLGDPFIIVGVSIISTLSHSSRIGL